MRIRHIAAIGFLGLMAILAAGNLLFHIGQPFVQRLGVFAGSLVGSSRMTAQEEAEVRQSFGVPADMPMKDVGVVKLRAGTPKRVRLGAGKYCTMTATVLTNGAVRLNLLYEFKGEVINGVKTPSYSERSLCVFRPLSAAGWRLCLFPKGQHFVVAIQPTIIP